VDKFWLTEFYNIPLNTTRNRSVHFNIIDKYPHKIVNKLLATFQLFYFISIHKIGCDIDFQIEKLKLKI
jgi:hypothetical protein